MKKSTRSFASTYDSRVRMLTLILAALLIITQAFVLSPAVRAAASSYIVDTESLSPRGANFIIDETGTLTDEQIKILNGKAAAILRDWDCAVYVWIVDLVPPEYDKNVDYLERYVDAFFNRNNLGYGGDRNGMVLLLEIGDIPGERDYFLNTHGASRSVFNNSRRERVLDDYIVPQFRSAFTNGNFFKVADVFYNVTPGEFEAAAKTKLALKLAAVILIPILTALIVCSVWKGKMKTAVLARTADNYIPANGFVLTGQTDSFMYRTTTRVKIEKSSSSGGSRSSSSGRSSGGKV